MNKLQALNWLVENVTKWPSKGKGVVSTPINWFWGDFTDGEVKLIKAEPTEMYADCHITQQEWLDVGCAKVLTPQEAYREFDKQTVELLQHRVGPIPKITITHPDAKPDTKWTKMPEVKTKTVTIKNKPQKIYIAGPMTGYENFNRDAFNTRAEQIAATGDIALNPAILPDGLTQPEYMQICLAMVMCADAIYLLKCYEDSMGAQAELSLAEKLGLKIIEERS